MYVDEDEDRQTYGKLFNRDVLALILRYVMSYRRHLFVALVFVLFIAGSNLLVPFLLRTLIDRHISKQGVILALPGGATAGQLGKALEKQLRRSVRLDDETFFLLQSQLKYVSAGERERLVRDGTLSDRAYLLLEPRDVAGTTGPGDKGAPSGPTGPGDDLRVKIEEMVSTGDIRVYTGERGAKGDRASRGVYYLVETGALAGFTTGEIMRLRESDFTSILRYVLYIIAMLLVQFGASYLQIIELMKLSQLAMKDLRRDLFEHILDLEVSFFDKTPIGKLVNRVTNDIETLNELFSSVLVTLFQDVLMMAGIALIMFFTDFRLALIVSSAYPFIVLFTILFRIQARKAYRLIRTKITALNSFINETITGIRIVQIFVREAQNFAKFFGRNTAVYDAQLKEMYANAVFRPLINFLNWFSIAAVIYFGARGLIGGRVSFGLLIMFVAYIERFYAPVQDLSEKFDIMQSATAAGEKLIAVLRAEAVRETGGAAFTHRPLSPGTGLPRAGERPRGGAGERRFKGEIVFDDVWFSYVPGEWVLRGLSFSVKPEQTLAIVGATGAGKTTVINLLARFHRVGKGRILIDGTSIEDISYLDLRRNIASVMQDVFLFSRTVKDNITLGNPYDEDWYRKVCEVTHVDRFIGGLPGKDLEPVMERGATFSAGERQLISFARALYANPSILVLDEATSNIDTETEKLIRDAIVHLTKGRTSIVIAHRLSTIRHADTIVVIDKGTIVEEGRHQALLAKKGIYHKLYTLQFNTPQ